YTAWINVATIANTTILLQHLGWNGAPLPEPVWSVVVQLVGAGIAIFVTWTRRNPAFGAVFVWAFVGIGVKYAGTALVAYTAYSLAAVILVAVILSAVRSGGGVRAIPVRG
ncbi:MAG: tryptophan-rich sensory protein, partial [Caldilineae bacterium]